jgi:hypothetical protein
MRSVSILAFRIETRWSVGLRSTDYFDVRSREHGHRTDEGS